MARATTRARPASVSRACDGVTTREGATETDALEVKLASALATPLPGVEAQLRMAPHPRVGWDPYSMPEGLREGAALLLIYPGVDPATPHVVLTVRGAGLRTHTGQVSFPGGAVDPSESFETAALREASEEVGIVPATVRLLGRLTPLHIPVSGFVLHPIIGIATRRPDFRIHAGEVARVLEVPIDVLRDPAIVRRETRTRQHEGQTYLMEWPYFEIDGEKVWGATAMALAEFMAIVDGTGGRAER